MAKLPSNNSVEYYIEFNYTNDFRNITIYMITVNVTNVTCRGCYHFRWSETSLGTL